MPFTNFDSRHFAATDKTAVNTALTSLETALANKTANLDAEERRQYGSVNEKNKLIINKIKDYRDLKPELSTTDVDWVEFANDFDTRTFIQGIILRLQSVVEGMESAKMLHDWDNYQASLLDYNYAKYKSGSSTQGYKIKAEEVAQFFTGGNAGTTTEENV